MGRKPHLKKGALYIGELKDTPLGNLWIAVSEQGLAAVTWARNQTDFSDYIARRFKRTTQFEADKTFQAISQLGEYLLARRRKFTFRIDWSLLSPFQQQVLKITHAIPYGETRTYGEIAAQIGRPRAARAVGRAEATNPMPLVIPCHRVIGADGKLHGYGGGSGVKTKAWLLRMEGAVIA